MIVVGDLHGTVEIPAFVASLVTRLSEDQPVVLALEMTRQDTAGLDAFLASDGERPAIDRVLRDAWWQFPSQDGRRSVAMLDLIRTVRDLRVHGATITVACFDAGPGDTRPRDPGGREKFMADTLIALRKAHPDAAIVVYVGNLHAMRKAIAQPAGTPRMANQIAAAGIHYITLTPRYADGTAWVCRGLLATSCGPSFIAGRDATTGIHLEPSSDGNFDGWFGVGAISASPPAAFPDQATGLPARLTSIRLNGPAIKRASRAYDAKDYKACANAYAKITDPTPEDAYNHAACLAQSGQRDAAIARLEIAVERGFAGADDIANDPDMAPLHVTVDSGSKLRMK